MPLQSCKVQKAVTNHLSPTYPVSGSAHVTLIDESVSASATKLRGLPGTCELDNVMAISSTEMAPAPCLFLANTLKRYFVSGFRPDSSTLRLSPDVFAVLKSTGPAPVKIKFLYK